MELINRNDVSLGLAPFDILGFKSEEELNLEISKLIKAVSYTHLTLPTILRV